MPQFSVTEAKMMLAQFPLRIECDVKLTKFIWESKDSKSIIAHGHIHETDEGVCSCQVQIPKTQSISDTFVDDDALELMKTYAKYDVVLSPELLERQRN